jgi:integrase
MAGGPAVSGLSDRSEDYLRLRRALGYKLEGEGRLLAGLVAHLENMGATTVTTDAAVAWAGQVNGCAAYLARRMRVARHFARYLCAFDPATDVPPVDLFPAGKHRPVPYIFSASDIVALMAAATELDPPIRAATFETVIGLLAATGMRAGEAMALNDDDIDRAAGALTVTGSKFGKSRQVLVHPSTIEALDAYQAQRDLAFPRRASRSVFVSARGSRLAHETLQPTFRRLVEIAGLEQPPGSPQPRPHSFRHTFAVDTLIGWYQDGGDVAARLPVLSTHLGHVDPAATYWYLSGVPELLALAAERLEAAQESRR